MFKKKKRATDRQKTSDRKTDDKERAYTLTHLQKYLGVIENMRSLHTLAVSFTDRNILQLTCNTHTLTCSLWSSGFLWLD